MIFVGFFLGILAAVLLGGLGAWLSYLWTAKGVAPVEVPKYIAGYARPKGKVKPVVHDDESLWKKENGVK